MNGHIVERCFRLHGFPPGFKSSRDVKLVAFSPKSNSLTPDQSNVPNSEQNISTNTNTSSASISVEHYNHLV